MWLTGTFCQKCAPSISIFVAFLQVIQVPPTAQRYDTYLKWLSTVWELWTVCMCQPYDRHTKSFNEVATRGHNMALLCILLYTIMQQTFPTFLERMRAGLVPEEEILAEFKFQSVLYSVYIFWDLSPHFFHVPLRRAYKSTSEAFYVTGNDGFWL